MARIRTVKPEFFLHEGLFDLEQETGWPMRIAFQGLWCQADREGRFVWQPRKLKAQVLPYDDVDFSRVLDALATRGFLVKYACRSLLFGWIPSFKSHQVINNKEAASKLPSFDASDCEILTCTRGPREDHACPTRTLQERKGKEGKGTQEEPPLNVPPKRTRFEKPTLAEVQAYCRERGNRVDAQKWFDHYESNGWRVGPNAMKDWQAAVRNWERGDVPRHRVGARNYTTPLIKDCEEA